MRRTVDTLSRANETLITAPTLRSWVERAAQFCASNDEIEDWSFLRNDNAKQESNDILTLDQDGPQD